MPPRAVEIAVDAKVPRREPGAEVVCDTVDAGLVERALVAVPHQVELQALALHAQAARDVLERGAGHSRAGLSRGTAW